MHQDRIPIDQPNRRWQSFFFRSPAGCAQKFFQASTTSGRLFALRKTTFLFGIWYEALQKVR